MFVSRFRPGAAQDALARHDFDRVLTLGGDCSVNVAPFAVLTEKHGDDLAVVWTDAHPDADTPETAYDGYHAMVVSRYHWGTVTRCSDRAKSRAV